MRISDWSSDVCSSDLNDPFTIRRELAAGNYRGNDPKALLVGREAYVEAGGRIDSDLFSDSASENWIDGDVLDRLADEKLAAEAESIRAREGYAEIRAVPMTRISFADYDGIRPETGRASCRGECVSTCRTRWARTHEKKKKTKTR